MHFDKPSWPGLWHAAPFTVHGRRFMHVEGWLQYKKHSCNPEFGEAIRLTASPSQAHEMGGRHELWADLDVGKRTLTEDEVRHWDASKLAYLKQGVLARYRQNPELAATLDSTGDAPLVYDDEDEFWGAGTDGRGANHLGKVTEVVRHALRDKQ